MGGWYYELHYQTSPQVNSVAHLVKYNWSDMENSTLSELTKKYGLTEGGLGRQISNIHLLHISRSYCKKWKFLPPHLGLKTIVAENIDLGKGDQAEKRYAFFLEWKQIKGSNATYKQLIIALLEIDSRDDAEKVCILIQKQPKLLISSESSGLTGIQTQSLTAGI